ncbi:hypothetical protein [Colwellia echini]|uniref:hypothetical protein n=1 Tax=Colwellia echini TaxID=1982103 RepID=UPI0014794499|nr:hypothetical protein [Colwellia echini]
MYSPGIEALLSRARQLNKEPLTPEHIERIRQNATVIALPLDVAEKTIQDRGYQ